MTQKIEESSLSTQIFTYKLKSVFSNRQAAVTFSQDFEPGQSGLLCCVVDPCCPFTVAKLVLPYQRILSTLCVLCAIEPLKWAFVKCPTASFLSAFHSPPFTYTGAPTSYH